MVRIYKQLNYEYEWFQSIKTLNTENMQKMQKPQVIVKKELSKIPLNNIHFVIKL